MMTEDEVKARYNLSKWPGIALLILMILVVIGLGLSVFAIVNFAHRQYRLGQDRLGDFMHRCPLPPIDSLT
jgi:hypothetical protein